MAQPMRAATERRMRTTSKLICGHSFLRRMPRRKGLGFVGPTGQTVSVPNPNPPDGFGLFEDGEASLLDLLHLALEPNAILLLAGLVEWINGLSQLDTPDAEGSPFSDDGVAAREGEDETGFGVHPFAALKGEGSRCR